MTRPSIIPQSIDLDAALAREEVIVTATERQAREIRYQLDLAPADRRCISQGVFFTAEFREACDDGLIDAAAIGHEGLRVLARDAAREPAWREHIDGFLDAWQLVHGAGIALDGARFGANEATRAFAIWARDVRDLLERRGFVSAAQFPALIRGLGRPSAFGTYGFTPGDLANFPFAARPLDGAATVSPVADVRAATFTSDEQELRAAADWARSMLGNADTIAIVVDRLGAETGRTIQRFQAAFSDVELARVVSISGGVALAQERPIRHGLELLRLMIEGVDREIVRSLLRSPFLAPPRALRQALRDQPSFVAMGGSDRHDLIEVNEPPPLTELATTLRRCLAGWGWPGRGLDSREYQAVRQFETLIDSVALTLRLARHPSWRDVLASLNDQSRRTVFSPQAHHAPIQVLGRDESFGLAFDAMWVLGCQRGAWPPPPRRNPFVPTDYYRDGTLAGGSLDTCQRDAQALQDWWQGHTDLLVQSEVVEDDVPASTTRAALVPSSRSPLERVVNTSGHPFLAGVRPGVVAFEDVLPTRLSTAPASLRGGTTLLTDQSACAFRGWAIHRLGLSPEAEQHILPTKAELGAVLHEILADVARAFGSRASLENASSDALAAVVDRLVEAQSWPAEFRRIERERLLRIVHAWRDLEIERPDFEIVAVEDDVEIAIGPLTLQTRVDRVDSSNEKTIVIDYKSGRASPNDWRPPRPNAPQVPVYAVDRRAEAAAFLHLDEAIRYSGVADEPIMKRGFRSPTAWGHPAMADLVDTWKESLAALAEEFVGGVNTPMPSPRTCGQCHLAPLCRRFSRG